MVMERKIIAHCIHHTHWDPFWYFTSQDSMVVFCYNMQEMLRAFDEKKIEDFFLDGQTAAIDEYMEVHPEDKEKISQLVTDGKLIIGPFVSQLDPFICCGESIINNLRLGMKHASALGKTSKIAYLADPFGQTVEFPKIFTQFDIHEFVFTRGVGDIYNLGSEFYFESNDGSKVLCHTMLAGYGYGTYAFMEKKLFTSKAEDYNKIDVDQLIQRLLERSTIPDECVFPLGFDQNPIMLHIPELIAYYKKIKPDWEFRYTNWRDYFARVRENGKNIKTIHAELTSPQYHRLHLSGMNSARADIKMILDQAERSLTYGTQPLMSMLDSLGIPYDQGIIDKAWYTLVNCQTHASATHIDATNRWMKENGQAALNYSEAAKIHLMRLVASSLQGAEPGISDLVVFNTIPWKREWVAEMTIITGSPDFELLDGHKPLEYSIFKQEKIYGGVIRKDKTLMTEDKWFYKTDIFANIGTMHGISYKTLQVKEGKPEKKNHAVIDDRSNGISNPWYKIECSPEGINIFDKEIGRNFENIFYLEDGGDEGDSYDYSYPDEDKESIILNNFSDAEVHCIQTPQYASMTVEGTVFIPGTLEDRAECRINVPLKYRITFELNSSSKMLRIHGFIDNQAKDHRVRFGIRTGIDNTYSYAGTQFGYVKRECEPPEMENWREKGFFEEPCSTRPLLNHVSAVGDEYTLSVFTRSLKEYQFTGKNCRDINLTLFRSVGYVGLPDLNRRPGRPSGLANKIFASPDHQMLGENEFDLGICFYRQFDANKIMRDYAEFAVDPMYYQNQDLDKTIYPIAYFPMNPLEERLPRNYRFLSLQEFSGSYGSVRKSEKENGYLLLLFNAEEINLQGGEIELGFDCVGKDHVNFLEEKLSTDDRALTELKKGELKNLLLTKGLTK
jgi:mannosylglycerate hydrolase